MTRPAPVPIQELSDQAKEVIANEAIKRWERIAPFVGLPPNVLGWDRERAVYCMVAWMTHFVDWLQEELEYDTEVLRSCGYEVPENWKNPPWFRRR